MEVTFPFPHESNDGHRSSTGKKAARENQRRLHGLQTRARGSWGRFGEGRDNSSNKRYCQRRQESFTRNEGGHRGLLHPLTRQGGRAGGSQLRDRFRGQEREF